MKNICTLLLLTFFSTAMMDAKPQAQKSRITRDEAQHIALAQVPDGRVKSAQLQQKDGKGIWAVAIAKRGSDTATQIFVDATSGHILAGTEPAAPGEGEAKQSR